MKRILLDTNGYAAFKKNDIHAVNALRAVEYIGLNVIVLGELLSGFKGALSETENKKELEQFLDSPRVHVLQLDEVTSEFYATIYWNLKRKGKPIPTNDMWVAASAMRHALSLFSYDEHFTNIEGLLIYETIL